MKKPPKRTQPLLNLAAIVLLGIPTAGAAEYLWIGGSSGNWSDGGNWQDTATQTTGTVPGVGDTANFNTAGAQGVTLDVSPVLLNLRFGSLLNQTVVFNNPGNQTITTDSAVAADGDILIATSALQDLTALSGVSFDDITGSGSSPKIKLPASTMTREILNPGNNGFVEFVGALSAASNVSRYNFSGQSTSQTIINAFDPGTRALWFNGNVRFNQSFEATSTDIRLSQTTKDVTLTLAGGVRASFPSGVKLWGTTTAAPTVTIRAVGSGIAEFAGNYQLGKDTAGGASNYVEGHTVRLEADGEETLLVMDGAILLGPSSVNSPEIVVGGTGTVRIAGAGRGNNTFNRPIRVDGGSLQLARNSGEVAISSNQLIVENDGIVEWLAGDQVSDTTHVVVNGGMLIPGAFQDSVGTLTLNGDLVVDFSEGNGTIRFASSATSDWNGGSLTIVGYAEGDEIQFGTGYDGLSSAQLAQITVNGLPATVNAQGIVQRPVILQPDYTPAEYVNSGLVPKPVYRSGHRLPRLMTFSPVPIGREFNQAIAEDWGYSMSLTFNVESVFKVRHYDERFVQNVDVNIARREIVALHLSDPERYPIAATFSKEYTPGNPRTGDLPPEAFLRDENGAFIREGGTVDGSRIWSPACPQAVYDTMAEMRTLGAGQLRILGITHLENFSNSGEFGLGTGTGEWDAMRDPAVRSLRGSTPWVELLNREVRRQHSTIYNEVAEYGEGASNVSFGTIAFYGASSPRDRGARNTGDAGNYGRPFRDFGAFFCDLPSAEVYYSHGWGIGNFLYGTGQTVGFGSWDMLTSVLNTTAQNIAYGYPLSFDWLSSGTDSGIQPFAERVPYAGWLKVLYTLGMTGGVEQFYGNKQEWDRNDPNKRFSALAVPNWLDAMMVHSHVQALFSHMDEFLFDGDLLPGEGYHTFSVDLPSYEYPTHNPNARVVARKLRNADLWLVTAWLGTTANSNTVEQEYVNASIPGLPRLRLNARSCGTVYIIRNNNGVFEWKQMDPDPVNISGNIPSDSAFTAVDTAEVSVAWDGITPTVTIERLLGASQSEHAGTPGNGNLALAPAHAAIAPAIPSFGVRLSQPTNRPVTINLATDIPGSTATEGVDFVLEAPTVTIPAGRTEMPVGLIRPINDNLSEGRERISVRLLPGNDYVLGTTVTANVDLHDDDKPSIIVRKNSRVPTKTGEMSKFLIEIFPVQNVDRQISFTTGGTAVRDVDYSLLTGTGPNPPANSVTIPAGQILAELVVIPVVQTNPVGDSTITITLDPNQPGNYSQTQSQTSSMTLQAQ